MKEKEAEKKVQSIDMLNGPLFGKIFVFALPVMLSGLLQLLFNAADVVVVGRFAGSNALAAVGATGSIINLIVNLLIGLSVGAAVTVGFYFGASEMSQVRETIHTSVAISLIGGVICCIVGLLVSPALLEFMDTPQNIFDQADLYLRIYFLGVPAMAVYNFGSSILRSLGDTKRPLYYLIIGGIINVVLNLLFVTVFHMGVAGVAIATSVSNLISGILTIRRMMYSDEEIRLCWREIRISGSKLRRILIIGVPAGLQSTLFSISNVLIQSSINGFGEVAVAGSSAASNIEGFVYVIMNSFYHASQTFTSQNVGGRKYERIRKVFWNCTIMVCAIGMVTGWMVYLAGEPLLQIYLPGDPDAIRYGMIRLSVIVTTYFICGFMEVVSGSLRGMGESVLPMAVCVIGTCLLRMIWLATVFATHKTLFVLYLSYPVSWFVTAAAHFVCYLYVKKRLIKRYA